MVLWRQNTGVNRGALRYRRGPSFMIIEDSRSSFGRRRFTLDDTEARVYHACESGKDVTRISRDVGEGPVSAGGLAAYLWGSVDGVDRAVIWSVQHR